jgi:SAM-dependent methyltransferase
MGIDFHTDGDSHFPREAFDLVMLLHVLEHFHDSPRDLLNDLLANVKPGGLLLVMVPNLANIRKRLGLLLGRSNLESFGRYYWMPGPWRGHVREYTRPDLVALTRYLGLELLELRGCHDMLGRLPPLVRPVYRAATALFPGWRDTWLLVARKNPGWEPRKDPPPEFAAFAATKDWRPKES